MNNKNIAPFFKLIALTVALLVFAGLLIGVLSTQSGLLATAPTVTPTPTKTPLPPTATSTATPTITPSPTDTATPTSTATETPSATPSPSPAPTATPTLTPSATPPPPTATLTPTMAPVSPATSQPLTQTVSLTVTVTATATQSPTLTNTLTISETAALTPSLPTATPTPSPTPVPRTVRADSAPDFSQAEPHFWFTRPYSDAFFTWGSWFYPYGTNNNGQYLWHRGIDIGNPQGTPILAVGDGRVVFAEPDLVTPVGPQTNFYGQAVIVQHRNLDTLGEPVPVYTLYGHVSQVLVAEGETVKTGQPIALTGQGGVALGPHLHLEVRLGDDPRDYTSTQNPDLWMRPDPGYGVIAGRVVDADGFYVPQQLITLHRYTDPYRFWRQTRTYPDARYASDPQWGETFSFSDVPIGRYVLRTSFDGVNFEYVVRVENQGVSFVLVDGASPPPPPELPASPTATPTPPPAETGEATPEIEATPEP